MQGACLKLAHAPIYVSCHTAPLLTIWSEIQMRQQPAYTIHAVALMAVILQTLILSLAGALQTYLRQRVKSNTLLSQDPRLGGKKVLNHGDVLAQIEGWIARGAPLYAASRICLLACSQCQFMLLTLRLAHRRV